MAIDLEPLPYATIVLHALKYPSKAVYGLLLGEKKGGKITVSGVVPLAHEAAPLAPSLETALMLVSCRQEGHETGAVIVGVYHAPQHLKEKGPSTTAIRLAEKIAANGSGPATIIELQNSKLSPDVSHACLSGLQLVDGQWKDVTIAASADTLATVSSAVERKLHRELIDFENHLDAPESDFYNVQLSALIEASF